MFGFGMLHIDHLMRWIPFGPWHWIGLLGIFGLFLRLAFFAAVVIAIVYLVRYATRRNNVRIGADSALDVLKRRYASGEIGREEYEQKMRDLS